MKQYLYQSLDFRHRSFQQRLELNQHRCQTPLPFHHQIRVKVKREVHLTQQDHLLRTRSPGTSILPLLETGNVEAVVGGIREF
jgi:hypothetical protein